MDRFELRYADYSLNSDQEAVRDAFHEFFANECSTERVRAAEPLGYDEKLWRQLTEMGAASMGLPESAGRDACRPAARRRGGGGGPGAGAVRRARRGVAGADRFARGPGRIGGGRGRRAA